MKEEIKVPSMGESITEATIAQVLKESGSFVKVDEEVLELETDKVNQVLYAPVSGVLTLQVKLDDVVTIDQVVGFVEEGKQEEKEQKPEPKKEVKKDPVVEKKKEEKPKEEPKASVGQKARVSKEDFVKEMMDREAKVPEKVKATIKTEREETKRPMSKIRQVIAKRLVESQNSAAMLTTFNEVDMTEVMKLRSKYKDYFIEEFGTKLGFMSFFVKAVVSALQAEPGLNSYINGTDIIHREYYDIGIAVGTEKGLVVPVVRGCDSLSFAEIEQEITNYAKKAREGGLLVDDLQGGGFTITNGGTYGSLLSTPILNPPQSGILGMHKIEKRAVVINDKVVVRPMMYLALSYDHRIVDGKEAVGFLVHIKECLEDPARMLLGV